MSKTIRTFIAIEIPENIISKIQELQESIKAKGFNIRWVRPENIHLTLKFIGDVEAAKISEITEALSKTVEGYIPISLKSKGLGLFPGIKNPRVLWVGLTGQLESLVKLQKTLDENLKVLGFPKEKRPFKGHLTMGRIKAKIDAKKLGDALMKFRNFESETFTADQIVLYKSELKPSGAVYTKLAGATFR
ncbi:MAG: RNA 2',3'-cyclic phosphodiesterase [Deltaproteobacteria bacterium]|jgi:2'-5' RNA ligase|nr:RNA 2',3'-cyclic phosphodiesterase [Deltaproteobacteria bacterium]